MRLNLKFWLGNSFLAWILMIFCILNDITENVEKQPTEWENFANHISNPERFVEYVKNSFTTQLKEDK